MANYNLFLDDYRHPKDVKWLELPLVEWTIVRTHHEFVATIKEKGVPNLVTYDCDLTPEHYDCFREHPEEYLTRYSDFSEPCGIRSVEYLLTVCSILRRKHPEFYLHTLNSIARPYMYKMIEVYNNSVCK